MKKSKIIAFQEQIVAEVGKEKLPVTLFEIDEAIQADIKAACETDMHDAIQTAEKHARDEAIQAVKDRVIASYEEQEADDETMKQVYTILDKMVKKKYAVKSRKIRFVQMVVSSTKSDHFLLKQAYYNVHMVQVYLHVDKHRHFLFVH